MEHLGKKEGGLECQFWVDLLYIFLIGLHFLNKLLSRSKYTNSHTVGQ